MKVPLKLPLVRALNDELIDQINVNVRPLLNTKLFPHKSQFIYNTHLEKLVNEFNLVQLY